MEGQESFVHRAAALMPALRVPLLLNNLVAMSLSFVACGDFILHNGYINDRAALALAIMFNLSIAQNLLVSVRYFQARRIKLLDRSDAEILPTVVAAVDIVLAVAFLILYIVETNYAASNPWYYANNTVKLYVAFGALIACVFHFFLAITFFHLWFKANRKDGQQRMKRPAVVTTSMPSPDESSRLDVDTIANEEELARVIDSSPPVQTSEVNRDQLAPTDLVVTAFCPLFVSPRARVSGASSGPTRSRGKALESVQGYVRETISKKVANRIRDAGTELACVCPTTDLPGGESGRVQEAPLPGTLHRPYYL